MTLRSMALALAALSISSAASAQSVDQPRTTVVRFDDLNLNSVAGRATLDRRITGAAGRVCANDGTGNLNDQAQAVRCRKIAAGQAQTDIRQNTALAYTVR